MKSAYKKPKTGSALSVLIFMEKNCEVHLTTEELKIAKKTIRKRN